MNEIILARTDRILHIYNIEMISNEDNPATIKTPTKEQHPPLTRGNSGIDDKVNRSNVEKQNLNDLIPCLKEKMKWTFDGQVKIFERSVSRILRV